MSKKELACRSVVAAWCKCQLLHCHKPHVFRSSSTHDDRGVFRVPPDRARLLVICFIRFLFLTQDLLHHSYSGRTGWDKLLCLHSVHHQAHAPVILYWPEVCPSPYFSASLYPTLDNNNSTHLPQHCDERILCAIFEVRGGNGFENLLEMGLTIWSDPKMGLPSAID